MVNQAGIHAQRNQPAHARDNLLKTARAYEQISKVGRGEKDLSLSRFEGLECTFPASLAAFEMHGDEA